MSSVTHETVHDAGVRAVLADGRAWVGRHKVEFSTPALIRRRVRT